MRVIQTERDAVAFMRSAKLALRYCSSAAPPLPSIYSTAIDKRRAIELTNALLARADVVETNVIAGRLVLVWRELVPALYALRVRFRGRLSADATPALELIRKGEGVNVGEVRRLLGVTGAQISLHLFVAVYDAMRSAYAKVDPAQASEAAFTATFTFYPPPFHVVLMRRTKPMIESGDPTLRRRAGLAIARLAREVMNQGSLLDLSIGSMLLARAAALARDSDRELL